MITANYTGSEVSYLDLDSTYLGCAVNARISVGDLEPCTVQFSYEKGNRKVIGSLSRNDEVHVFDFEVGKVGECHIDPVGDTGSDRVVLG